MRTSIQQQKRSKRSPETNPLKCMNVENVLLPAHLSMNGYQATSVCILCCK